MGCAQLHVVPPTSAIDVCLATLSRAGVQDTARAAANMAWALAVLQVRLWYVVSKHLVVAN